MASEQDNGAPVWFSIREAAAYLKVGEPTIYRWMRDGRITYRKVGDSTRFLREDLDAVVDVFPSERDAARVSAFCPACHSPDLVEGDLRSTGLVHFQPARTRFWTLRDSAVAVRAVLCARCGTVSLRGDATKLAALVARGAEPEPPTDAAPTVQEE